MGPVHSNCLLFHDHSCRPVIISGMFLLSRLYEHYCTLQFSSTSKHYNNIPKIKFCGPLYWKNIYTTKCYYPHLQNYLD